VITTRVCLRTGMLPAIGCSMVRSNAGAHTSSSECGVVRKAFSIASTPEEGRVLIGTSVQSGSSFKQRLAALRPGDKVGLRGPLNQTFKLDGAAPQVVLLAQGVGITPMRAMLAHAAVAGLNLESSLIHVSHDGHAYRDEAQQWATSAEYPQHAADFRTAATVAATTTPDATFFIAGASQFVSSTASLLRESGVTGAAIRTDKHLGYKPRPQATRPLADDLTVDQAPPSSRSSCR